jgi:Rps23 Pro-64 3,4-dihydroxylase Tpa1-like proline 4-hydroxylase
VLKDVFGTAMVQRLLAFAMAHETEFVDTWVGPKAKATNNKSVRSSRAILDFGDLRPALEEKFQDVMASTLPVLGLSPFNLASLSLELVAHGDGDFYRRHIDTHVGSDLSATDRVLTCVYYFHNQPKAFQGGELRLFSLLPVDAGGTYADIAPENDSMLVFPSWAPHEVRQVSCPGGEFAQSRFAINCWCNREAR